MTKVVISLMGMFQDKEEKKDKGDKDEKEATKIKHKSKDRDPFKMHKKKNKHEFTSHKPKVCLVVTLVRCL